MAPIPTADALQLVVTIVAAWIALGALGLVRPKSLRFVSRFIFPAGACVALLLAVIAFLSLDAPPQSLVMPLGLPDLPFHVRLDPLSAFFLLLIGAASFGVSLFSAGYFRASEGTPPGLICFQYHVFLAGLVALGCYSLCRNCLRRLFPDTAHSLLPTFSVIDT